VGGERGKKRSIVLLRESGVGPGDTRVLQREESFVLSSLQKGGLKWGGFVEHRKEPKMSF